MLALYLFSQEDSIWGDTVFYWEEKTMSKVTNARDVNIDVVGQDSLPFLGEILRTKSHNEIFDHLKDIHLGR